MADFNRHLKRNKILVFLTISTFLYMSCFVSCSKSNQREGTEAAQKSEKVKRTEKSEVPRAEAPARGETPELNTPAQSDKSDADCGCPSAIKASAGKAGQQKPLTQEELNQKADMLDRYFKTLEVALKEIPKDSFDPQAILGEVGKDPEALFKWVRDNTHLVPYQGVLRGPVGVLLDRTGNSLDRALLLCELLRLGGYETQLVRGTLSTKQTSEVLKKLGPLSKRGSLSPPTISPQETESFIEKYMSDNGLSFNKRKELATMLEKEQKCFYAKIAERVDEQSAAILKSVQKYRKSDKAESASSETNALEDHWWVRVLKDNIWLDLDPTLPGTEMGKSLTETKDTYKAEELPEDLFHRVCVRLIIEQAADGRLEEHTVLNHTLRPSELLGQRILLQQIPLHWPTEIDFSNGHDPAKSLRANILEEKEWLPILTVGSNQITQSTFTTSGAVQQYTGNESTLGGIGGITGGLFNALAGDESNEQAEKPSYLTAEWIEYEIISPGRPAQIMRRQIFDLLGPSTRKKGKISTIKISDELKLARGLAIMKEIEDLIQVCDLSSEFVCYLFAKSMLANRDILPGLLRLGLSLTKEDFTTTVQKITPLPGPEYSLALLRLRLSKFRDRIYVNRPNIIAFVRGLRGSVREEILKYEGFDIVSNEISVYSGSDIEPFLVSCYQGILDTNIEGMILKDFGGPVKNTAETFAESRAQGIEWLSIIDAGDTIWKRLELPDDVRSRIEHDLAQGYVIMIPQKGFASTENMNVVWWRINPSTGNVLGIGENGDGQGLSERILLTLHAVQTGICIWHAVEHRSLVVGTIFFVGCFTLFFDNIVVHMLVDSEKGIAIAFWIIGLIGEFFEIGGSTTE